MIRTSSLLLAALCAFGQAAFAQQYPTRPIHLVVTFAPGGGADLIARSVSDPLSRRLGQPVVVDNRPGAGGTIGADAVAKSAPDGYTLLFGTPGPQITNPYLMRKLPYDPVKDFAPVAMLSVAPNVLVVHPSLAAKNVKELIALAKAQPGKLNFSSAGIGATSHLAMEYFNSVAGTQITHVPYKGTGAALQDLLAGNVQMAIDTVGPLLPFIKSGQLRALGVTTPGRIPLLPDVPTIADTLPGFEASSMNYIATRAGTPQAVITRLNHEINAVVATPEVRDRLISIGAIPTTETPEQLGARIKSLAEKWKKVIEISGAKVD